MTDKPVVYYHTAAWCAPCKQLKPRVEKLCDGLGVEMRVIDVDKDAPVVGGFTSVPAVAVFWPDRPDPLVLVGQTLTIATLRKALS